MNEHSQICFNTYYQHSSQVVSICPLCYQYADDAPLKPSNFLNWENENLSEIYHFFKHVWIVSEWTWLFFLPNSAILNHWAGTHLWASERHLVGRGGTAK